jgi:hypothetical protein
LASQGAHRDTNAAIASRHLLEQEPAMIRLGICVVVLGGAVAFLSCNSQNGSTTGGGPQDAAAPITGGKSGFGGKGGNGAAGGSDGRGPVGTGGHPNSGPMNDGGGPVGTGGRGVGGINWGDGSAPVGTGGRGVGGINWGDGAGPVGTGGRGVGGINWGDGAAPVGTGGRGVGGINWGDGAGPVGTGGRGVGGINWGDGAGPVGGPGGHAGVGGYGGGPCFGPGDCAGGFHPCDGLPYFELAYCESSYAERLARPISCASTTMAFLSTCGGQHVWFSGVPAAGGSATCVYDAAGTLTAARICDDAPRADWNCNGAAQAPRCLSVGAVPDTTACARVAAPCDSGGHGGP